MERQTLFIGACNTFFKVLPFDSEKPTSLLRRGLFLFRPFAIDGFKWIVLDLSQTVPPYGIH